MYYVSNDCTPQLKYYFEISEFKFDGRFRKNIKALSRLFSSVGALVSIVTPKEDTCVEYLPVDLGDGVGDISRLTPAAELSSMQNRLDNLVDEKKLELPAISSSFSMSTKDPSPEPRSSSMPCKRNSVSQWQYEKHFIANGRVGACLLWNPYFRQFSQKKTIFSVCVLKSKYGDAKISVVDDEASEINESTSSNAVRN